MVAVGVGLAVAKNDVVPNVAIPLFGLFGVVLGVGVMALLTYPDGTPGPERYVITAPGGNGECVAWTGPGDGDCTVSARARLVGVAETPAAAAELAERDRAARQD